MAWLMQHWSEITVLIGLLTYMWKALMVFSKLVVRLDNHMRHTEESMEKINQALTILLDRSR